MVHLLFGLGWAVSDFSLSRCLGIPASQQRQGPDEGALRAFPPLAEAAEVQVLHEAAFSAEPGNPKWAGCVNTKTGFEPRKCAVPPQPKP